MELHVYDIQIKNTNLKLEEAKHCFIPTKLEMCFDEKDREKKYVSISFL